MQNDDEIAEIEASSHSARDASPAGEAPPLESYLQNYLERFEGAPPTDAAAVALDVTLDLQDAPRESLSFDPPLKEDDAEAPEEEEPVEIEDDGR